MDSRKNLADKSLRIRNKANEVPSVNKFDMSESRLLAFSLENICDKACLALHSWDGFLLSRFRKSTMVTHTWLRGGRFGRGMAGALPNPHSIQTRTCFDQFDYLRREFGHYAVAGRLGGARLEQLSHQPDLGCPQLPSPRAGSSHHPLGHSS